MFFQINPTYFFSNISEKNSNESLDDKNEKSREKMFKEIPRLQQYKNLREKIFSQECSMSLPTSWLFHKNLRTNSIMFCLQSWEPVPEYSESIEEPKTVKLVSKCNEMFVFANILIEIFSDDRLDSQLRKWRFILQA